MSNGDGLEPANVTRSSGLADWVRSNLAMAGFLFTVLGALVGGTWHIADYSSRLDLLEQFRRDATKGLQTAADGAEAIRIDSTERRLKLSVDLAAIDVKLTQLASEQTALLARFADLGNSQSSLQTRIDEIDHKGSSGVIEIQRTLEAQLAALSQRDALLEQQVKFVGDYIRDNFIVVPAAHRR